MTLDINTIVELSADGLSPGSATFSSHQAACTRHYFLPNPNDPGWNSGAESDPAAPPGITASDLQLLPALILGTTGYNGTGDGRLQRILPFMDPVFPMWASEFALQGKGKGQTQFPSTITAGFNTAPNWNQWTGYNLTITYTTRNYAVLPDSAISLVPVTYYDDNGILNIVDGAPEWLRFCYGWPEPIDQWIEQQRGSAYFETGSGDEPNGIPVLQTVKMLMPDSVLNVRWIGVPYRYLSSSSSYLMKFRGHVNQDTWFGPTGTQGTYNPGSLLYLGPKLLDVYMPPTPIEVGDDGAATLSFGRLMDVDLTFLYTSRVLSDAPVEDFENRNFISTGFNALPYLPHRDFYGAFNLDLEGNFSAMFHSFPVSLLFSDPDIP